MKIKKLEIVSYGKWFQKTFDIHQELQVFTGPNESGKSSVMNVVSGIFYGFPKRKSGKYSFESELSAVSGGKLTIDSERFGELVIERTVGKTKQTLTITKPNGEEVTDLTMDELLYNVSKENFEKTYAFNLQQLQDVKTISPDDLHRYFLSIGLSGSEQLLEVSEQFKKEADSMYTKSSSTRELDKKIKLLNQEAQKVRASKSQDEEYQQLLLEKQQLMQELAVEKNHLEQLQQTKDQLSNLVYLWPSYQQWQMVKEQITIADYQDFDGGLADEYQSLKAKEQQLQERLKKVEEQLFELSTSQEKTAEQVWFMENQASIEEIIHHQEEITNLVYDLQEAKKQLPLAAEQITILKQQLGIESGEELPLAFTIEEQNELHNALQKIDHLTQTKLVSVTNRAAVSEQIDQYQEKIAEMKEQLLPDKDVVEMQSYLNQAITISTPKQNFVPIILAVAFMILAFLLPQYKWLLIAAASMSAATFIWMAQKPKTIDDSQRDSFTKLLNRQANLETEIGIAEGMKQVSEQELANLAQKQCQLDEQIIALEATLKQAFEEKQYRKNGLPIETLIKDNPVKKLERLITNYTTLKASIHDLEVAKSNWLTKVTLWHKEEPRDLFDYLKQMQDSYHRLSLRLKEQELKAQQLTELTQEKSQLTTELETISTRITAIYQATETSDYDSFIAFWQEKTNQEELRKQELFLREMVASLAADYQEFADEEELQQASQISQQDFQTSQEKTMDITETLANCAQKITAMEESGIYQEQVASFYQDTQDMRELVVTWGANRLASEILERTLLTGKEDKLEDVVRDASTYFKRLTNERYQALQLSKTTAKVKRFDGKNFTLDQLSRGTLDQLYVAMRLAFVKNSAEFAPLPMIIDDGFVNFDIERKKVMLELLKEISQSVQIIYFTFDTDMAEYVKKEQITTLTRQ
ncbi:Uncharacterized protein YhaN [Granulicatella balaenopterae]|uniref:Uncharacterized protein YhaN n=1 Tax=Granulicatella balaenopterae TaxID=137733 RepID=A0A1H9JTL1_9LACT|nr:AAA family ATPase [Granulicatella balaenopterae]SEQ90246.1 Uncharacterized protein YhaN [Granulicatella balaenopterae]